MLYKHHNITQEFNLTIMISSTESKITKTEEHGAKKKLNFRLRDVLRFLI